MAKKLKKTLFTEMRWAYMTFAVLGIIFAILVLAVPSIVETIEKAVPNLSKTVGDISVKTYLLISLGVSVLVDLLYFNLITRVADGRSKGTVLLVLLILRVATAIVGLINSNTPMNMSAIIDVVTLFGFFRFKNESE
ncbi:MAG: hypothetical protein IJ094_02365 [Bacilli bacterium]|nr:hypothetical protein [Bacilli bacterium]